MVFLFLVLFLHGLFIIILIEQIGWLIERNFALIVAIERCRRGKRKTKTKTKRKRKRKTKTNHRGCWQPKRILLLQQFGVLVVQHHRQKKTNLNLPVAMFRE